MKKQRKIGPIDAPMTQENSTSRANRLLHEILGRAQHTDWSVFLRRVAITASVVAAYGIGLHWTYAALIAPQFGYLGYYYTPAPVWAHLFSFVLATVLSLLLPNQADRPSAVVVWVINVVVITPTTVLLPSLSSLGAGGSLAVATALCASLLLTNAVARNGHRLRVKRLWLPHRAFWIGLACYSILVHLALFSATGFQWSFPSLGEVYEVRDSYAEARELVPILGYIVVAQANVVNPFILARGVFARDWTALVTGAVGQLLIFSQTGLKSVLFSLLAIALLALVFIWRARPRLTLLLGGATAVVVSSALVDIALNQTLWSSLFTRRFLVTPTQLTGYYFDFFSRNPPAFLGNSVLAPFIHAPYPERPSVTIAQYVLGDTESSMNAHLYASAYAEFGWVGIVAAAALFGGYLWLLDRLSAGLPVAVSSLVAVMLAVTVSNTSLHTSVLSHGLLAALILVAVAPRGHWSLPASRASLKDYIRTWLSYLRALLKARPKSTA